MSAIPDHVSIEPESPFFLPGYSRVGVRLNGEVCPNNVVEFCVSEGWVRQWIVVNGKPKMERGRYLAFRRQGRVEPFWRDAP
jgi:hypothetical protein